jgi:hypothetical protein
MQFGEHVPEHLVDERDGVGAADGFVLVDVGGRQAHVLGERHYVIKRIAPARSRHARTIAPFRLGRNVPGTVPP